MAKPKDVKNQIAAEIAAELAQRRVALSPERIAAAYRNVFQGEDGEIVLADLRAKFNGTTVRIRPSGIDPSEVIFREGQRALYLMLCERAEPPTPVIVEEE